MIIDYYGIGAAVATAAKVSEGKKPRNAAETKTRPETWGDSCRGFYWVTWLNAVELACVCVLCVLCVLVVALPVVAAIVTPELEVFDLWNMFAGLALGVVSNHQTTRRKMSNTPSAVIIYHL